MKENKLYKAVYSHVLHFDMFDIERMIKRRQLVDDVILQFLYDNQDEYHYEDFLEMPNQGKALIADLLIRHLANYHRMQKQ